MATNNDYEYGTKLSLDVSKFTLGIKKALNSVSSLSDKVESVKNEFRTGFYMDTDKAEEEFYSLRNSMQELQEEMDKIKPLQYEKTIFDDNGTAISTQMVDFMPKQYQEAREKIKAEMDNIANDMRVLSSDMDMINLTTAGKIGQAFRNLPNTIRKSFDDTKQVMGYLPQFFGDKFDAVKNKITEFKSKISETTKGFSNFFNKFKFASNKTTEFTKTMARSVTSLKRFALSLFGVQSGYMAVRRAISAYMSYDSDLQSSIQKMWAGFGSLLAPVLEYLVSLFQKLLAYTNAVVKALTGIDYVARANSKALEKQGKSASKSLAGFDELNNIAQSSGSGNTISLPEVDAGSISDYFLKLKEMFLEGDYYGIGYSIATKISEALANIPWDVIQTKAKQIGTGIAELLNGAVDGTNWNVIGNTIAQGLNTAIYFASNFLKTFNFENLGVGLGTALSTMIKNINWSELALAITNGIVAIPDAIYEFFKNLDVIELANAIEEFFMKVDYGKIASSIFRALGMGIGKAVLLLGTFFSDAWESIKLYFDEWIVKAEAEGGNIWDGILLGISNGIKNIGKWIYDNMMKPFVNAFKEAFEIHSPSKVMERLGGYIVDGFKNGISTIWNKVVGVFIDLKAKMQNKVSEIASDMKNKAVDIGTKLKDGFVNGLNGLTDKLKGAFKSPLNAVIGLINSMINKINSKLSVSISSTISSVLSALGVNVSKGKYQLFSIPNIPALRVGTDYVNEEGMAYLHKGESVVPADVVKGGFTGNSDGIDKLTNLLERFYDMVDSKDYRPQISVDEVGKASVDYIRSKSVIMGGSVI